MEQKLTKIYVPNLHENMKKIGGGFRFIQNFYKGMQGKVEFVNTWQECDIVFVFGITTINKEEIHTAINAGKKLVLRVDNIPRKSRNKRQSPAERLTEFGNKASLVVYQSQWCKKFAGYFIDNENNLIINNGVDTGTFNIKERPDRELMGKKYLYINYNDNPNKRFDEAIYRFEMDWREDNDITLTIAGNAPKVYTEHPEYNWDLNVPAKVNYVGIMETPEQTARLMLEHDFLLYPSFCEAYPNTVLEAMACDVHPLFINEEGGAIEAYLNSFKEGGFEVKTIQEMCDEYYEAFKNII